MPSCIITSNTVSNCDAISYDISDNLYASSYDTKFAFDKSGSTVWQG